MQDAIWSYRLTDRNCVGHRNTPGLTPEFVDQVIAKSHAFYDLPQDKKDKYSVNRYWKGYVKLGDE